VVERERNDPVQEGGFQRWARVRDCAPGEGNGSAISRRTEKPAPLLVFWMINHYFPALKTERPAPFWCTIVRNLLIFR
jgi:hypothetical protein